MASSYDLDLVYMSTAVLHSKLSKAIRKKVGAVLVTPQGVTLTGYNGTPIGVDNTCEDICAETGEYITKPSVLHAEINCILKAAREGVSVVDSTIYITLSPCLQCSAMLIQAGVKKVVYLEQYRDEKGLQLLECTNIQTSKFEIKKELNA